MGYRNFVRISMYVLVVGWAAVAAAAGWQPHQIKQGDGKGGFILHPAQRQVIGFPNGGPTGTRIHPTGLVQMDTGTIAMIGALMNEGEWCPVIAFSSNGGDTWSDFQMLPKGNKTLPRGRRPMMFTYLGNGSLSYRIGGYPTRHFSSDYGQTWLETVPVPPLKCNGRPLEGEGNAAVDRDANGNAVRVMEIGFNWDAGKSFPRDDCTAEFRYSLDGGRTWQGEVSPPTWKYVTTYNGKQYTKGVGEGSVVRAGNGWLVAALRTDVPPRFWSLKYDELMGTAISISKDNGQTWSPLNILFDAGRHHANLQRLPNNGLLLTMINREDISMGGAELDSHKRGCEALLSHDNGLTWNHVGGRFELDQFEFYDPSKWYLSNVGHLGTVVLKDGSALTAYGKYTDGSAVLIKWNPASLP